MPETEHKLESPTSAEPILLRNPRPASKQAGGTSAKLLIGATLLGLLAGGGAAWLVTENRQAPESASASTNAAARNLIHLDEFTVNLADPGQSHFLRMAMDLELDHSIGGVLSDKDSSSLPKARIRDSILSVLTACKADDLLTTDGKQQLKKNLLTHLHQDIPDLGVHEIYFTEFLVQR